MPDERQDIRQAIVAAGLDLAAIHAATIAALTREDQAVALVHTFGALRQRDLALLMEVSGATISRLVTALLATGKVREQGFKDGTVGRPTEWLLPPGGEPPSYQQRQAIIACLPDVIAYLDTMSSSTLSSSSPGHIAVDEPSISPADPPAHATLDIPFVSGVEPSAQMALARWYGTLGEDPGAHPETSVAIPASNAAPPIASLAERSVPLPRPTTYVPPPRRNLNQSPVPPWERSRFLACPRWPSHATVRRGAASMADCTDQLLGLMLRLLILGGHLLWVGLRLLGRGIQKLVWLIDDLNDIVVGRRWLLLGVAVVVVVGMLISLRRSSVGIRLPVASPPSEVTPTEIASTALTTTLPVQIRRAQIVGTGKAGLIVRDAPAGKRIGKLANGVAVIILSGPQTVTNQEDPVWWNVQHDDVVGWVSARFLHVLDEP